MHRFPRSASLLSIATLAALPAAPLLAQDGGVAAPGGQVMVMSRAGGDGDVVPHGMFFSVGGPISFAELMRPEFLRRDLALLAQDLELDDGQSVVLEALLDQYRAEFELLVERLKDAQRRFTPPELRMALDDMNRMASMPAMITFGDFDGGDDGGDFVFMTGEPIELTIGDIGGGEGEIGTVRAARVAIAIGGPTTADGPTAAPPPLPPPGDGERNVEINMGAGDGDVQISVTDGNGNSLIDDEGLKAMRERIAEHMRRIEERLQKYREEAEKEGPPPTPEEMAEIARGARAEKDALRERFETDLALLLNETQAPRLGRTLRHVRRGHLLPFGELSGESLDVARVLRERNLLDAADLEAYELRLDELLRARHAALADREIARPAEGEQEDAEARLNHARRMAEQRTAIRDLHEAEIERLAYGLDPDAADALRDEANRLGYPDIFRPSTVVALHERALELPDLDDATRDAIAAARDAYAAELDRRNDELLRITRENEPKRTVKMMEQMQRIEAGDFPDGDEFQIDEDPMFKLMGERSAAAMKARQHLRSILGDERFESIPGAARRSFRIGGPRG